MCDSEFYGLSFLANFSLHLSLFPVLTALAFQPPILIRTETSSASKTSSPYNTVISSSPFLPPFLFLRDELLFVIKNFILVSLPEDLLGFSVLLMHSINYMNRQQVFDKLVLPTRDLQYYTSSLKIIKLLSVFFAVGQDFTCFAIQHRS